MTIAVQFMVTDAAGIFDTDDMMTLVGYGMTAMRPRRLMKPRASWNCMTAWPTTN